MASKPSLSTRGVFILILEESGCFPSRRYMDNLFFKPNELAAGDRKENKKQETTF